MDGKLLLLACVAILGGAYFLGSREITLGPELPVASTVVVDLHHEETRETLRREGRDLADPASYVEERDGALVVGGPVAATEHLRPVFIDSVVSDHHRPVQSEVPDKVRAAVPVADCRFSPPARRSRVANIFSNATSQYASFFALGAEELEPLAQSYLAAQSGDQPVGPRLQNIVARMREKQVESAGPQAAAPFRYSVMDVAVTETDSAVHLVLQTGQGRVLWNLHLARGAKVSGVSLLGGHLPAVANLPRRVPVEVMDAAAMADCDIAPARLPRATDPIFRDVDSGALPVARARAGLEEIRARSEAWNGWFAEQFGQRSDETRIGYDRQAIMAVVGPLPESEAARVPYQTLEKAQVVMAEAWEAFGRDTGAAEARVKRLARERAEAQTAGEAVTE